MTCLTFFASILQVAPLGINGGKEVSYGKKALLKQTTSECEAWVHGLLRKSACMTAKTA